MAVAKASEYSWDRLETLFAQATDLPPGERIDFATKATEGDAGLRADLLALLNSDAESSGQFITDVLGTAIEATTAHRQQARIGQVLGDYRLESILGHGGTGTVYLAERADRQYSTQVAVKILDNSGVYGDLSLRFRAERQILASLNYPHIAKLFDAGETQEGQPFLVMEYIQGIPLDSYCDRHKLDVKARLELFLKVCGAVHYAHQNLIVHRDLKPANILVTADASPKLLDFGIAKLLETKERAALQALTRVNERLLTPEYASPEQIQGRKVTTASDVYALGVVLYELLSGMRPFAAPTPDAGWLDFEQSICVTDPSRPSTAIKRIIDARSTQEKSPAKRVAEARGTTPEKLRRRLLGDLDAIVMRALRKEPEHRYGSVEQLAADVRHYLAQEPVVARQGNWLYYSQRFVRRHRLGVVGVVAFVAVTIGFAVAMSNERDKAANESKAAQAVSGFMLDVFAAAEPYNAQGKVFTAEQLLEESARQVRADKRMPPEVKARLLAGIGRAFRRSGDPHTSRRHLEEALSLRRLMPEEGGLAGADDIAELAVTLRAIGDVQGSEEWLKKGLNLCEKLGQQHSSTYAKLLTNLGRVEFYQGRLAAAELTFEAALELNKEVRGEMDQEVAVVFLDLASVYMWKDDAKAAEKVARSAIHIFKRSAPELHPDRVMAEVRLADALMMQERYEEAGVVLEGALHKQRLLFGDESRQVAEVLDSMTQIRLAQNRFDEAERLSLDALHAIEKAIGSEHGYTPYFRTSHAVALIRSGKLEEAENQLRHSLATLADTRTKDHQYVSSAEQLLGELLLNTGRFDEAEIVLRAAMERWERTEAPAWRSARAASALGEVLFRNGRKEEGRTYLLQSYEQLRADEEADREVRVQARRRVDELLDGGLPRQLQ